MPETRWGKLYHVAQRLNHPVGIGAFAPSGAVVKVVPASLLNEPEDDLFSVLEVVHEMLLIRDFVFDGFIVGIMSQLPEQRPQPSLGVLPVQVDGAVEVMELIRRHHGEVAGHLSSSPAAPRRSGGSWGGAGGSKGLELPPQVL